MPGPSKWIVSEPEEKHRKGRKSHARKKQAPHRESPQGWGRAQWMVLSDQAQGAGFGPQHHEKGRGKRITGHIQRTQRQFEENSTDQILVN